jgi:glycosyltransferase involved in cell wall biosynthesis
MKILLLGTRGIPSKYGGFETCVEEISSRLAKEHQVVVYSRSQYHKEQPASYNGVHIVYLPTIKIKFIDTLYHTLISLFHALLFNRDGYFMVFNAANTPVLLLAYLFNRHIALNTDGLEWKRDKWGNIGKVYFQFSEWLATKIVKNIVTDSQGMHDYYLHRWGKRSTIIEYGAYLQDSITPELLHPYKLEKNQYFLQITRLEPENNPLLTIKAFLQFKSEQPDARVKLVIVGDNPYSSPYATEIKKFINEDIVLTGYQYDRLLLNEFRTNCLAYIHGNQVGGTNPALLEAMGASAFVLAREVNFNQEVLQTGGKYFKRDEKDLCQKMKWVHANRNNLELAKNISLKRIKNYYNWDRIATRYEKLFTETYLNHGL